MRNHLRDLFGNPVNHRIIPQLLRFGFVGAVGAAINFFVYYAAVVYANFGVNAGSVCAFGVAVAHNYLFNHRWTFGPENEDNPINLRQFMYYLFGNVWGLLINLIVLNSIIFIFGVSLHFVGQVFGIFCGMLLNFLIARQFVFSTAINGTKSSRRRR